MHSLRFMALVLAMLVINLMLRYGLLLEMHAENCCSFNMAILTVLGIRTRCVGICYELLDQKGWSLKVACFIAGIKKAPYGASFRWSVM